MQQPFKLRSSRYLALLLAIAHAIAVAALIPLDFPVWARFMAGLTVLYSAMRCLRRDAWLFTPPSSTVLTLENDGTVLLTRNGEVIKGRVLPSTLVSPHMIVLYFAPTGARWMRSVIILPDSLDAESFRQLRVQLRWGRQRRGDGVSMHPDFS